MYIGLLVYITRIIFYYFLCLYSMKFVLYFESNATIAYKNCWEFQVEYQALPATGAKSHPCSIAPC